MVKAQLPSFWTEVISIIESGLKPNPQRVGAFADHLANRLEEHGETRLAQRIRGLVENAATPAGSNFGIQRLGAESLVLVRQPPAETRSLLSPVLHPRAEREIDRFIRLNLQTAALARQGLNPPTSILLYGPPGCGKTTTAAAIAKSLGLPLLTVRLDSLLTSYLGDSAKNLRQAFEAAASSPSILFLDEFDAVAKMRDDPQEIGEMKRLVNSLLQNIDATRGELIVIAATNHEHLLDPAVWRRFDVDLELGLPGKDQAIQIIDQLLGDVDVEPEVVQALGQIAHGLTGADICSGVIRALQDSVLDQKAQLPTLLSVELLHGTKGYGIGMQDAESGLDADNKKGLILTICAKAPSLNNRQVAILANCSQAYVHQVLRNK